MPTLASPATESPEITATASGRNSPSSMVREARATKSPFSVMEPKKSGPSSPGPGEETLTAIEINTGTAASTSKPAWLRRRPKISRSSERRNLVEMRRGRQVSDRSQPLTSKPSPVSETKTSSRDGAPTRKPSTGTP